MFSFFVKTENDRKRDDYDKLHSKLQDALVKHDKKAAAAEESYSGYIGSVPNLSNNKIPSNDFDPKREELNRKLDKYFDEEKQKRRELHSVSNQAYQRYIYYKNLAMKEAVVRKEKRRKEWEEFWGYGKR